LLAMNENADWLTLRSTCFAGEASFLQTIKCIDTELLKSFLDTHQEARFCAP